MGMEDGGRSAKSEGRWKWRNWSAAWSACCVCSAAAARSAAIDRSLPKPGHFPK